jgi:hypothetical protein
MTLSNLEFSRLYAALVDKVHDAYKAAGKKPPKPKKLLMGYDKTKDSKSISIDSLVKTHPAVVQYLQDNKRSIDAFAISSLYDDTLLQEAGEEEIELKGIYEDVYFLLFDCKNKEEFFNKFPTLNHQIVYHGWYYSQDQTVKHFELTIRETFEHVWYGDANGFHSKNEKITLVGSMTPIGSCWLLAMRSKDPFLYLDISIHKGDNLTADPELLSKANFFKGIIHSINSNRDLIAVECFLIRTDINGYDEAVLHIKRYLNLVHNHFQVRIDHFRPDDEKIDHLRVQEYDITQLVRLANQDFRILTYNFLTGEVHQSRLHINDDLSGVMSEPVRDAGKDSVKTRDRACRLSLNHHHMVTRLLVEVKENANVGFSTFTIIEIPDKMDVVIHGAFCTQGGQKLKPIGGLFIMALARTQVEPKVFSRNAIGQEADAEFRLLVNELLRIHGVSTKKATKRKI